LQGSHEGIDEIEFWLDGSVDRVLNLLSLKYGVDLVPREGGIIGVSFWIIGVRSADLSSFEGGRRFFL
jgi:hypothetical protein